MRAVLGVELAKLGAQWRLRVALLLVLVAPPLVTAVLQAQTGLPTDTLYGRWVQEIGLSVPLVLLGSAGAWGIPVLASLVSGDLLSSEDGHGTWGLMLSRSRTRWQVFGGKVAAAGVVTVVLVTALAVSSVLAGVLLVGDQPLVGLTGQPVPFGRGLLLVGASWLSTVPGALAVAAGALLASALSRNSLVGVVVPVAVSFVAGLVALLAPLGGLRPILLAPGAWHGLLREDAQGGPVLLGALAGVAWTAVLLVATVLVLRRRDWAVP